MNDPEPQMGLARASHVNEEQFRLLVSSVQDYAIFMLDVDGYIVSWNAGAERIKGYRWDEVTGRHFSLFYGPEDIAHDVPAHELVETAANERFSTVGWRVRKDGSRFFAHVVITALRNDHGELCGYAKVTRDISTRQPMDERFHVVVESMPSAIVMSNQNGTIEMVNAQAERVFGYPRTELVGQPVEMLVPDHLSDETPVRHQSFFAELLSRATGTEARPLGAGRNLYARRKDGSEFPVEIGLNPIETEQGSMVLSTIVDISDRKQKEESIEKALAEKDILLGEIHHRVKNNLQIVHSLLDLQCTQIDDPAVQQMLRDSQNRIRSMAIIHQTLYQSKDFAATDFTTVLSLICHSLLASYGVDSNRIRLVIDAKEVPLAMDKAIPCGLIVNELVTNSLKHAFPDSRSGVISIKLVSSQNRIELTIEDDGVGISLDIDLGMTGTLGLQLVNLLTEQIRGELEIRRADPTRFVLQFPL